MLSWHHEVTALGTVHCHHGSAHLGVIQTLPCDTLPRDCHGSSSSCMASGEQGEGNKPSLVRSQSSALVHALRLPPPDSHPPCLLSQSTLSSMLQLQASGIMDLLRSTLKTGGGRDRTGRDTQVQGLSQCSGSVGWDIDQRWAKRCHCLPTQS